MQVNKTEVAKKLIQEFTENGISKYSKKKLAEIAVKRYPDLFTSIDNARYCIRLITNSAGKESRQKKLSNKVEWNGFQLPEPEKDDFTKVIVNQKRIAVLSDIHFPYYDRTALNLAIKTAIEYEPDCIILNGDIIDCYHLSSFEKDPKKRSFFLAHSPQRLFPRYERIKHKIRNSHFFKRRKCHNAQNLG